MMKNCVMIDNKLYNEFTKAIISSPSSRWVIRLGTVFVMVVTFYLFSYCIQWQITRGEFYIFSSVFEFLFMYVFPLLIFILALVLFVLSFSSHRILALNGRTGHKREFFKNSADKKQVKYCTALDADSIQIDKDGETIAVDWSEVVGVKETKNLLLLILDVSYVYKQRYTVLSKRNVQPVYVLNAVILGKDGFEQGSLEDVRMLLEKKGIGVYDKTGTTEHVIYK